MSVDGSEHRDDLHCPMYSAWHISPRHPLNLPCEISRADHPFRIAWGVLLPVASVTSDFDHDPTRLKISTGGSISTSRSFSKATRLVFCLSGTPRLVSSIKRMYPVVTGFTLSTLSLGRAVPCPVRYGSTPPGTTDHRPRYKSWLSSFGKSSYQLPIVRSIDTARWLVTWTWERRYRPPSVNSGDR